METFFKFYSEIIAWLDLYFWDAADITLMSLSAVILFLCRYPRIRDAIVGTALLIGMVYQIYETLTGTRVSAPSDVYADLILFLVIFASGGNIMTVIVVSKLVTRIKSIWRLVKLPFTFTVKK
ncbi:hypothetical protein AB6F65_10010 [Providencia hangzhouensis]|uniref:hypothetical protein n=1 Tax=Providencia hangzhouensis TaxID=3031799 RepID=UPI0034DD3366